MKIIRVLIPCLLFQACMFGTSKNATFYTLLPATTQALSSDYSATVIMNRVKLPQYVERPQLVTLQKNSSQVKISEFNRWAEPPTALVTRVIIEDVSNLLPGAQIKNKHVTDDRGEQTVSVEITELNAVLGGNAQLIAWYTLKNPRKQTHVRAKFTAQVPVGKTYEDVVNGYSQLLALLSREIATALLNQ